MIRYSNQDLLKIAQSPLCSEFQKHKRIAPIYEIVIKKLSIQQSVITKLNKLSTGNFQKLSTEIIEIIKNATSAEISEILVILLKKAMIEKKYVECYANLAHKLIIEKAHPEFDKKFRDSCRDIFNKFCFDAKHSGLTEIERKDFVGFAIFLCNCCRPESAIFKVNILITCIIELRKNWCEINAEVICKLLETSGRQLEFLDKRYMLQLLRYLFDRQNDFSTRIKFMIQQILTLSKTKWKKEPSAKISQPQKPAQPPHIQKNNLNNIDIYTNDIIEEYLKQWDFSEIKKYFSEDFKKYSNEKFIVETFCRKIIHDGIWKNKSEIEILADLLRQLIAENFVSKEILRPIIHEIIETQEDIKLDIPRIDEIIQQFLQFL